MVLTVSGFVVVMKDRGQRRLDKEVWYGLDFVEDEGGDTYKRERGVSMTLFFLSGERTVLEEALAFFKG